MKLFEEHGASVLFVVKTAFVFRDRAVRNLSLGRGFSVSAHTAHMSFLKKAWRWGKRAFAALSARRYTTVAGTLTFFLIMSLVPFTFWLVLLFGNSAFDPEQILQLELFGWARELLYYLKTNAVGATAGVGVLFLATTLWSSTSFFYHLRRSGEILYDYRRKKHGWKVRLSAVLLTFGVLMFFAATGALLLGVNYFARTLPQWLYYPIVYSLVLSLGFLAAWTLNSYICPYRCRPQDTALGSLLTALAWLIASGAFSVYLHFTDQERLYGALSLLIVFFLWLYWMMICFTAGVVFNRHRMKLHDLEHKTL